MGGDDDDPRAGVDPEKLLTAIAQYEYRVATAGGISPSEIQRTSGDPRSGYSLSISRQGQREAQRKFSAVMRAADERVMSKTASLCNRFLGEQLPESGYRVSYQSLPLSPEEMRATREDVIQKLNAGLISPIDAIQMLNPDMDEEEARRKGKAFLNAAWRQASVTASDHQQTARVSYKGKEHT